MGLGAGGPTVVDDRSAAGARARRLAWIGTALGVLALLATVPPVALESPILPLALAAAAVALGITAFREGARRHGGYALFAGVGGLLVALLIQGAEKATVEDIVTAGLFAATLRAATPLVLTGLGGLLSERAGVTNIALEGLILMGAFFGIFIDDKTSSWAIGLVGAMVAGGLLALVHAFFSIHLQADQIVSGTAVNILAGGITVYCYRSIYGSAGVPAVDRIPTISVPGLRDIPFVGDIVGEMNLMIWVMLVLTVATWAFLFKTPWGLRLRAVGEHPRAADTVGISVYRMRYLAVTSSGLLAGLAGAFLSFGLGSTFNEGMSGGRGFIALAAVIFGMWRPFGLFGAALLFGFASALGDSLQTSAGTSANLVGMLPYALTLIALVGLVGRSTPPAAVGRPYAKQ